MNYQGLKGLYKINVWLTLQSSCTRDSDKQQRQQGVNANYKEKALRFVREMLHKVPLQYHIEKHKEVIPLSYLLLLKCGKVSCTLHRPKKANLHFLNSLVLEIAFCNWHAKYHTLHLLQDEALNAYSFPFWKHLSTTLSTTIFHEFTTFLQVNFTPNGTQAMAIPAVSDHTCSEQGLGLDVHQKPPPAPVSSDAPEHQAAECMFAAATRGHFLYSDATKYNLDMELCVY